MQLVTILTNQGLILKLSWRFLLDILIGKCFIFFDRYSVFALGSSNYPNFCAFGHYVDDHLKDLGGKSILTIGEGDELNGQDESFREWAKNVFKVI